MRYFTIVLGLLALFYSGVASAQTEGYGILNAVSYSPLKVEGSIAVETYDNSAANLKLKELFEVELRKAGYTVSDTAKITLSFEGRDEAGAWVQPGDRTYIELHNNPEREGSKEPKVLLNLYNSTRGGVFNTGKGNREVTPRKYRLDTTIDYKTNGRRIWHAWSVTNVGASDSSALAASMIPLLVKSLGKAVRGQAFEIK
ncbi:MAG: hypothetical protein HOJ88_03235 [Proteobacteria bacterium]|jgi:hypothetical protein|nr:hypothetical protein [Pseudomonadota bacterium]